MASPVTIGDALLLAKIAYTVGKAFSGDAKSAPKEFREVQSLLFSLQAAFTLLDEVVKLPESPHRAESSVAGKLEESIEPLLMIMKNCRDVLEDLEKLQAEYHVLDRTTDSSIKKSKIDLKRAFKTLKWTTEGLDIAKLKQTLTAHITSLNLALAAMSRSKALF